MKEFMESNVLYSKSKGYDPKVWDDTILIKAYDEAIDSFKKSIGVEDTKFKNESMKNKNKKKGKQEAVCGWKVGNRCKAIFANDENIYEATIISIDSASESCVVKYRFYGNEETHKLKDLIPLSSNSKSVSEASSVVNSVPSKMSECSASEASFTNESTDKSKPKNKKNKNKQKHFKHPTSNIFINAKSGFPNFSFNNLPHLPPPPVPDISKSDGENEALKGMLISWYMSGYYAGYYQGLKSNDS